MPFISTEKPKSCPWGVYYREEEPGCGVYLPERYYQDSYDDDSEHFTTIKEAAAYVSGIIGKDVKPDKNAVGEALDEYMEEQNDEDVRYSFHEFAVVNE